MTEWVNVWQCVVCGDMLDTRRFQTRPQGPVLGAVGMADPEGGDIDADGNMYTVGQRMNLWCRGRCNCATSHEFARVTLLQLTGNHNRRNEATSGVGGRVTQAVPFVPPYGAAPPPSQGFGSVMPRQAAAAPAEATFDAFFAATTPAAPIATTTLASAAPIPGLLGGRDLSKMSQDELSNLFTECSQLLSAIRAEIQSRTACVACLHATRKVVMMPCRHLTYCAACVEAARRAAVSTGSALSCPMCKQHVTDALTVFTD